ncbi:MAG: 4Fe-4S dicluster domain-containing protein [Candidatus Hadarchaeota archaeon]
MKRVKVNEKYCVGCGLCEVYCRTQHSETKDIVKAHKKEDPRPVARVRREEKSPTTLPVQCRHCEEAPCIDACITGAMDRVSEDGTVQRDEEKCVGCWTCIMVCPVGAIKRNEEGESIASKCDLCQGEETPVCVENCPNEALRYEEVEE